MRNVFCIAWARFVLLATVLLGAASTCFIASAQAPAKAPFTTTEKVGILGTNRYYTPANQVLTPAGVQVELPGLRPQAIALSPNGRLLVTSGRTAELVVLDPATGKLLQKVPLPKGDSAANTPAAVSQEILHPDRDGQLSFTGLIFSPDGSRFYLANVDGDIKVFEVNASGQVSAKTSFGLPAANAPRRKAEIAAGLAISKDGKRLYVALNLSNRLAELDAITGQVLRLWDVGVAPYAVVLSGQKAYVSNWGGRRPDAQSLTGPAGHGTLVRVDPVRHIASEGSVSVIDLSASPLPQSQISNLKSQIPEIVTGLHASALALSPNGRWLAVANAGSDTISVLDTRNHQIIETLCARQNPADLFGAQPNALAFDKSGDTLFACNGSQNAVAVFDFKPGQSALRGLIPVGWFPGALAFDATRHALYVANIKGIGSTRRLEPGDAMKFNSHQYLGTLSLVPVPDARELARLTEIARVNLRYPLLEAARQPARPNQPPRAVPERVGEPSLIQHVIYIIQENRTYDQVLGDLPLGNGDRSLCAFGERVTPNHHACARQFVLLDNTYCSGILSADGHQWADSAMATDYMEKSFAGFPRSYVHGMNEDGIDALAYSPAGFIWDNVVAHGKTLRDYGEYAITETRWKDKSRKGKPGFLDFYLYVYAHTGAIELGSRPAIESLRPYLCTNTVGWALNVPDIFRARQFIKELHEFEKNGNFPNLCIICLPNDHTCGTKAGLQTPAAMAADNDLAFGQILEAVSHSRFWKDTCLFAIEDDPQAGWDHVSGYRTTCYVASPYARRGTTVSVQYNQTSVLRTIELMLGLPPMNQMDATATPMTACFTDTADCAPYTVLTNNIPLDQINPSPKRVSDRVLRKDAYVSARLPLDQPDQCPEDTLNRILWHALKGTEQPYPDWAVTHVRDED
jgi:DNA-binding beta-propeller fold protein YncE